MCCATGIAAKYEELLHGTDMSRLMHYCPVIVFSIGSSCVHFEKLHGQAPPATMMRWLMTSTGTMMDWVIREAVPPATKLAAAAAVAWLGALAWACS